MKFALFAFNGEPMCFVHVMLNALDMQARGHEVAVVIEGTATRLVKTWNDDPAQPFANLYVKIKEAGLIHCVCQACSAKMGSRESAEEQGLKACGEMNGHPSVAQFIEDGYQIVTF